MSRGRCSITTSASTAQAIRPACGTGHPAGARVLAVLEAFGAMTHERPYREPCSPESACKALIDAAGTQFDPEVAELFVEQIRRAPRLAREDVSEAVLDAMPLEPGRWRRPTARGGGVDGATLLGNHQRLQQDRPRRPQHYSPFGVVLLELATCRASTRSTVMSRATC